MTGTRTRPSWTAVAQDEYLAGPRNTPGHKERPGRAQSLRIPTRKLSRDRWIAEFLREAVSAARATQPAHPETRVGLDHGPGDHAAIAA